MPGTSVPGVRIGPNRTNRNCLWNDDGLMTVQGTIDSGNAYDGANTGYVTELRAGTPLAVITATKKFVPCKRTTVTPAGGATSADVPVVDARAFKVGDVITVGGDTSKTITAINYSTNTITVSGGSFTFANDEAVFATTPAGSATCRGILNEHVVLRDEDGTDRDKQVSQIVVGGGVRSGQILGDLAAIRADTSAQLSQIAWDDRQGAV